MKKFIVIYHNPAVTEEDMANASPEDMKGVMDAWMNWAAKCGPALVEMGAPLTGGQKMNPDGSSVDSAREVTGYSVLQAENMAAAKALLHGHPHLNWAPGCEIEVHETAPMPG